MLPVDFLTAVRLLTPVIGSAAAGSSPSLGPSAAVVVPAIAEVAASLADSSGPTGDNGLHFPIPEIGRIVLSLAELCALMDSNRALQLGKIVSTECYAEEISGVIHRFLVVEVRLLGKRTVWLRLDRRMERNVSYWQFLWASGETAANDMVRKLPMPSLQSQA
ncbi:hypothetical protein DL93DRAFT_817058 [Clavulina sp. PMI_390]|nr:hypothetical protein DL93DRAFT_817058 [Clavulina sp. PMI_390]